MTGAVQVCLSRAARGDADPIWLSGNCNITSKRAREMAQELLVAAALVDRLSPNNEEVPF